MSFQGWITSVLPSPLTSPVSQASAPVPWPVLPLFETVTPGLMTMGLTSAGEVSVIPMVVLLLIVVMTGPSPPYAQQGNE